MSEEIDERVSVNLLSNHIQGTACPTSFYWRGRRYTITKLGLHHTVREGKTLLHIFSATDGESFFKLEFNTDRLSWRLLQIDNS